MRPWNAGNRHSSRVISESHAISAYSSLLFKMSAVESQLETFVSIASPKIDEKATDLQELSLKIWERPELGYEEHFAHSILCDFFEEQGFEVTREYTLPTAFRAVFGGEKEGPAVAVLCEYDALPGIGHGCGHNLIAIAGNFFLSSIPYITSSTLWGGGGMVLPVIVGTERLRPK